MVKQKKSYQQLKEELEAILSELQHEDTDIDKAIILHKQGQDILKQLEAYLGQVGESTEKE